MVMLGIHDYSFESFFVIFYDLFLALIKIFFYS